MKIRTAIVALVLALLALIVVPQRDAGVVVMRNTPQLAGIARAIPAPAIERSVAATPGDPAQTGALYVPVANSNAPAVLLVNGAEVPGGWHNPDIETLATSIADLGLAVYVPDLPGVEHGSLSVDALNALKADQTWFTQQRGRDSLVGVCVGASLSLLVAANAPNTVHSVVAIDPYASLSEVLRAATTGSEMVAWVRADLVRSLATTVPDGQAFIQALTQSPPDDPLAGFRREPPAIDATSQAWWRLLGNADPSRFQNLYDALPQGVRSQL